ncbi:MAG TPA: trypsin-like peptidase domain-containing protein [Planctomycetota bacterium]|nr:trypsin-like peptidase domain-containing protein [Planctomycetota bacterium]
MPAAFETVLPRERTEPSRGFSILWALASSLAVFALVGWRFSEASRADARVPRQSDGPITRADLTPEERATIELFKSVSPSVVNVTNLQPRRDMFSRDVTETPFGSGSGFLWDEEGHVVTNFHVIYQSTRVQVTFAEGGKAYDADVIGTARHSDLAVLKLRERPRGLRGLTIGRSSDLLVGQKVFAVGNPFGLDQTLTTGVISGLGREIRSLTNHKISDVIQTDAAINPGNSGGPLLDSSGRLIGVNTAIVSPSGAYAGVGFAVPVDVVKRAVPQLIEHGRVERPGLGITHLTDPQSRQLGLRGVGVRTVAPDSAAERAGLQDIRIYRDGTYDVDEILAIDGKRVASVTDLYDILDQQEVGDVVKLTVRRGSEMHDVRAKLQALEQ